MTATVLVYIWGGSVPLYAHDPVKPHQLIRSAAEYDYPPFSLVDEEGQATGFSVELLRAALATVGHEVSFAVGPWSEVKQALIDHSIHVLPLVGRTPEREAYFDFTFPYIKMHGTIIVRDSNTTIKGIADLKGKEVAVLKGDNAEEFLRREQVTSHIITTGSFETALVALSQGYYDAVVIQKLLAMQLIRKNGLNNLRPVGRPLTEFEQSFCFAVPKGHSELLAILNEGLSIVSQDGTFQRLQHAWFSPLEQKKSRIVVGGDSQYPPYEYLDENGQPAGFNVDLTRAIARQLNLDIKIELDEWSKVRQGVESGRIDLVQGMFYSVERDRAVNFSPAHSLVGHVIVNRKNSPHPENLEQLQDKTILVMRGDILHDLAVKQGLENQLIPVSSQEEALRLLAAGNYDCALVARIPALYWAEKHGWDNLNIGHQSVLSPEYCYAALPENQALLTDFSEALQAIKNSAEYRDIYNKWFGGYEEQALSPEKIMAYALLVIAPCGIVFVFIVLWNKSLKAKVREKTSELEHEVSLHKRTTKILAEEKRKFHTLFEHVVDYALVLKRQGNGLVIVDLSDSACRAHGYTRDELLGQSIDILDAGKVDVQKDAARLEKLKKHEPVIFETTHKHRDGSLFPVEVALTLLELGGEELIFAIERDITNRKKVLQEKEELEKHIRQKYKMEAIGVMAGGIAHNFNNNLAIILGNLELAQLKSESREQVNKYIENARIAVRRSRDLIQQMMTYSRQQSHNKALVQPNLIIEETLKLLQATLPASIEMSFQSYVEDRLTTIHVDSTQLEEALINLCTNAVDAMNEKGSITIELTSLYLRQADILPQYSCAEGSYVCISVSDTGSGMDQELIEKIFDPFFTTKSVNRGTGMGLATLHGFVKKSGGMIRVSSTVGRGSRFELLFPLAGKVATRGDDLTVPSEQPSPARGDEHLLLIDDEEMLVDMTAQLLTDQGYQVTTVVSGERALALLTDQPEAFDLIITDQMMPGLTGLEFIEQLRAFQPEVPVILCTGYSRKIDEETVQALNISAVCLKPLETNQLFATIRTALRTS